MEYMIRTQAEPCTLEIRIRAKTAMKGSLKVYDRDITRPDTVLANRPVNIREGDDFIDWVPMPLSPWIAGVRLDAIGEVAAVSIEKKGLKTHRTAIDWKNPEVRQAVSLGNRFCYNMGWLPTLPVDEVYCSPDGTLKVKYLDQLLDPLSGKVSVTPMRIDDETNIIEASRARCVLFTVAGRAVMFFHEFSHKFENSRPDWELEADLNGLTIYLGLGYSPFEALQVYSQVFHQVDTPENRDRLENIKDFINNFESLTKKHIV